MSLDKVRLLIKQDRFDIAEEEVRRVLASTPDDGTAHALLSLILDAKGQPKAAIAQAQQAIGLAPDDGYGHYILGRAYRNDKQPQNAEKAAQEALALSPTEPRYHALMASICYTQLRWEDSLTYAQSGLAQDPHHATSAHFYALSLLNLGRLQESTEAVEIALRNNPNSATAHEIRGWIALEAKERTDAMGHFQEALRLEPMSKQARRGIITAMKERNFGYRMLLRFLFWMSVINRGTNWIRLIVLALLASPLLFLLLPLIVLYPLFIYFALTADTLSNLLLRFDSLGRMVLTDDELKATNYAGILLVVAAIAAIAAVLIPSWRVGLLALNAALMIIPLSTAFKRPPERGQHIFIGATIGLGLLALVAVGFSFFARTGMVEPWFVIGVIALVLINRFWK